MQKRTFLKLSSALMATPFIPTMVACEERPLLKNWAENLTYSTENVINPKLMVDLQRNVRDLEKLRILGTRHCFNTIADSEDNLVTSKYFNALMALDIKAMTVTVQGGIKYGELAPFLEKKGFALHNLASLPHISVAGACATATHGSGVGNGNLATAVVAYEFLNAKGEIVQISKEKDGEKFNGAVVSLGALGPVTKVTLAIQPTFQICQHVYQNMPMSSIDAHFDKIMSAGYSVSLFTDWQKGNINEVWIKSKIIEKLGVKPIREFEPMPEFFGGKLATKNLHPIAELSADNCTEQMGIGGAWHDRLPHFKMGFTPSSGKELQSEFFVDRKDAVKAIRAVEKLSEKIGPLLMTTEIRTIAADNLWLSTAYKRDSVAIHFTWKQEIEAVMALLPEVEAALEPFEYRPHWGKIFTISPEKLRSRYEKMADFVALATEYDPDGKFRNEFMDKNIFG
jgi:alditol oxidase